MPSSVGHALTAVAIGSVLAPPVTRPRYWITGALAAALIDVDALGRPFGMGDLELLGGHRALTHSLPFAIVAGVAITWLMFRGAHWEQQRWRIAAYLVLTLTSHGILDAFAGYGSGVAFLFPFSDARFAAPWRPLRALNEVWLIWLPALVVTGALWRFRRSRSHPTVNAAV